MGAGLSGLCCAITLEQNGVEPTIFEKRRQAGDRFVNGEILLTALIRPIDDCIAYLAEKHGIYLRPLANIKKLLIYSENAKAEITGNLGFSNLRGRDRDSFENQLAQQVKSKIHYNSSHTYEHLLQDYTHVVMATGDASYTMKVQDFRADVHVTAKGATVTGDFDRYTTCAWLNNNFAPKGYAYFIPLSEKEAHIVIAFPVYPESEEQDPDELWQRFYDTARRDLGQELKITDRFQIKEYIMGICRYPRIGNTFFTGNCFGAMMPFMGFGQFASILTGVYAAYDICGKGNYDDLTEPLRKSYENSLVLRRAMEKLDNKGYDIFVNSLDGPLGDKVFNSRSIDLLKLASFIMRPLVKV